MVSRTRCCMKEHFTRIRILYSNKEIGLNFYWVVSQCQVIRSSEAHKFMSGDLNKFDRRIIVVLIPSRLHKDLKIIIIIIMIIIIIIPILTNVDSLDASRKMVQKVYQARLLLESINGDGEVVANNVSLFFTRNRVIFRAWFWQIGCHDRECIIVSNPHFARMHRLSIDVECVVKFMSITDELLGKLNTEVAP